MTIQIEITPEIQDFLQQERYAYPDPIVQRRMETLWLKSNGLPHAQIAKLVCISENTMREYFRMYKEGGLAKLKERHSYRPTSALQGHASSLEAHFREHPPATIKKAQHEIEQLTGIKRSPTQIRRFLHDKLGMRCRKIGMIPAKADPDVQAAYATETLEPRLAEAKAGSRAVFFVDAAHFVLAPFLGYLWTFVRVFIQAPAGRQRFNVLAAMNAITHELVTVTNDTYITAKSVCDLLHQVAALELGVPITLLLDNARYQKCALVKDLADSLQIELCFLPAYSPNLNLIERLWKFVKNEVLYSQYYADFKAFKVAISMCLDETHTKHKSALDSLLTLRFQTFKKAHFLTV